MMDNPIPKFQTINISFYFGIYFLVFGCVILAIFQNSSSLAFDLLLILSPFFIPFIVPYYAFKYSQGAVPKFWDFFRDNIWLMILAHIKTLFVISFFSLLLILPGLYKYIHLSFYTETVLFDKHTQGGASLKQTQHNAQGYFRPLALFSQPVLFPLNHSSGRDFICRSFFTTTPVHPRLLS